MSGTQRLDPDHTECAEVSDREGASWTDLIARGGAHLLQQATLTTLGIRFPADDATGLSGTYPHGLYSGAAGVGIVLLELERATGDRRYARLCDAVRDGIVESTPCTGPLEPGLYRGYGGVALYHLVSARLRNDRSSLDRATELGLRLTGVPHTGIDLISGAAGAGLLFLSLFHATLDAAFLHAARAAAAFLDGAAIHTDRGAAWRDRPSASASTDDLLEDGAQTIHAGLAHGVAGVCLFLTELSLSDPRAFDPALLEDGFRWLDANAVRSEGGVDWPRNEKNPSLNAHWCHGAAGIAHAYLARYRSTGRAEALASAVAAGWAVWQAVQRRAAEPACHCHGLAGALELCLELEAHGAGSAWRDRATMVGQRIRLLAKSADQRPDDGSGPSPLGGKGAGLSIGAAGVLRQLLRLQGNQLSSILLPERQQLRIGVRGGRRPRRAAQKGTAIGADDVASRKWADLLPRAAVRFAHHDRHLIIGAPEAADAQHVLRALRESRAGRYYFEALQSIESACRNLQQKHATLLAPAALTPATFAPLLREFAGMSLHDGADARRVRSATRCMTANAIGALETLLARLGLDRYGALRGLVSGWLTSAAIHASDPHRGGERAVSLRFEDGPSLIYKARSLHIDCELAGDAHDGEHATLAELARHWLRPSIDGGRLSTHRIIPAGAWHGYAECVLPSGLEPMTVNVGLSDEAPPVTLPVPCVTRLARSDERRFWYSAGLLAGHAFSLGLHDLHPENVVCGRSQACPDVALHAVDLELAFGLVDRLNDTQLVDAREWPYESSDRHTHAALEPSMPLRCGFFAEEWALALTRDGLMPLPQPRQAIPWEFPHLARNADDSFGYAGQLCAFLRGMTDQWTVLREHATEAGHALRAALVGQPARVLCKPTRSYCAELTRRKVGGPPLNGVATRDGSRFALAFMEAELRQLEQFDFPYFFRVLADNNEHSDVRWMARDGHSCAPVPELASFRCHAPFWTIIERQSDPGRFASAVADAVDFVAPSGPFDAHDRDLGVRAVRPQGDQRIWIVLLLGERRDARLTCRTEPGGQLEWWLD